MCEKNVSIEKFLQSVCKFISTEERAKEIQDELKDHIYSYIEEYTENGMSEEEATTIALKQMGDPNALSKMYKDRTCKISRLLHIFAILTLLSISTILEIARGYITNLDSSNGFYIYSFITILIVVTLGIHIIDIIKTHKKERKLSNVDPLFYIQSYKSSILEEKLIKYAQISILVISFVILIIICGEFTKIESKEALGSYLLSLDWLVFTLFIVFKLSILTPKGKHIAVYSEGILTFNYFIPMDSIKGYMWSKESKDDKDFFTIDFCLKKSYKIGNDRAPIKVSSSQINLINELLKNKNISETNW